MDRICIPEGFPGHISTIEIPFFPYNLDLDAAYASYRENLSIVKNLYPDEPTDELERERRLAELEVLLQRLAREARSA
ncbi:MAG: hypothetical protein MI919_37245, partial [Holophagales bacterium]|nr:hypothetical protein [Holophagales bacterium]